MKKYEQLARDIVQQVGGVENIHSLFHCVTRLRFRLKDSQCANKKAIEAMDGVISVVEGNGQFQVVIGNAVCSDPIKLDLTVVAWMLLRFFYAAACRSR